MAITYINLLIHLSPSQMKYASTILSFSLKLFRESKSVKSLDILLFNINLINPIQKYSKIIESYACNIQVCFKLLPINF